MFNPNPYAQSPQMGAGSPQMGGHSAPPSPHQTQARPVFSQPKVSRNRQQQSARGVRRKPVRRGGQITPPPMGVAQPQMGNQPIQMPVSPMSFDIPDFDAAAAMSRIPGVGFAGAERRRRSPV